MVSETNFRTPIHPGEILHEEFMVPLDINANQLAKRIGVPANRITSILHGDRGVTADTALRLSEAFGTTPEFWLNLQSHYELEVASREVRPTIVRIMPAAEEAVAEPAYTVA